MHPLSAGDLTSKHGLVLLPSSKASDPRRPLPVAAAGMPPLVRRAARAVGLALVALAALALMVRVGGAASARSAGGVFLETRFSGGAGKDNSVAALDNGGAQEVVAAVGLSSTGTVTTTTAAVLSAKKTTATAAAAAATVGVDEEGKETGPAQEDKKLVPLEAHIMSKCPDAKDCLKDMILPAMMQVQDIVNFTLSYIGVPTDNDGVSCRHGPEECLGNILELCAADLYPDPKTYLGFTMCLTRDFSLIPQRSLIEDCALEHAVDFEALNACATRDDGAYGMKLLRESVKRTAGAGVVKSCTVRLDGKFYCVRDDAQWVDCPQGPAVGTLVKAIKDRYEQGPAVAAAA